MCTHIFVIESGTVCLRPFRCAIALAILAMAAVTGRAQDGYFTQKALQDAPANVEDEIKALGDKGALFQFNYWGEAFANLSGGVRRGGDYEGLLKISLSLDLQKLVHWNGAILYASMLYPHGNGITDHYVHDYNILSNIDAYDSVRLSELWLQQTLFDGRFSIRAGELVTDNDFFVSTNSALFVNSAFAVLGTVLHDVIPPIYPVASEGVRLHVDITPSFYVQAMAIDDNPGAQNLENKHGARFDFTKGHGVLSFFEAGYVPDPLNGASGLGAAYKVGAYFDSKFRTDISTGPFNRPNCGFYALVDQPLYIAPGSKKDAPQGLSAFARISYAPDDRNPVEYYFDTGFNYIGPLPRRPKDIFGAAFSFERLGTGLELASGAPVLSHHEHVLELTYLATLSDWFSLQPDLQYIINPGGIGRIQNAFVAGVRFNVTF